MFSSHLYAGPGATVFAPRGSRHTFQNIGSTPGRTISTVVPGGLDEFFEEIDAAAPAGTVPDPAQMLPLNSSAIPYQTIVTISESPKRAGLIYAGTDDGHLQVLAE